jgi:hypothetical protein
VHVIIAISKGLEVGEERSGPWPLGGRRFSFFSFYASSLAFGVRRKDTAALKGQKKKKKERKKGNLRGAELAFRLRPERHARPEIPESRT